MIPTLVFCALALTPRLDADGVPLPPEALRRVGSALWRYPAPLGQPFVSADGRRVYTPAEDFRVVAWHAATGRQLDAFHLPPAGRFATPNHRVEDKANGGFFEFDLYSHRRLMPLPDGRLRVIDAPPGDLCVRTIDPTRGRVHTDLTATFPFWDQAELSHDGRWVAATVVEEKKAGATTTSRDLLKMYDTRTRQLAYQVPIFKDQSEHRWSVIGFSPDDRWLAVATGDSFRLLDTATGQLRRTFTERTVSVFQFSPDSKTVAGVLPSESDSGYVAVWDTSSGRQVYKKKLPETWKEEYGQSSELAYRPDANRLAMLVRNLGLRFLDASTGATLAEIADRPRLRGAFSPSGERFFATAWHDYDYGAVYAVDLTTTPPRVHRPSASNASLAYPSNRDLVFASGTEVAQCDLVSGAIRRSSFSIPAQSTGVHTTVSANGRRVTLHYYDPGLESVAMAIDLTTGGTLCLSPGEANVSSWYVLPAGKTAVGTDGGDLVIWNLATNKITNHSLVKNKGPDDGVTAWVQADYGPWVVTKKNTYSRESRNAGRIEVAKSGPVTLHDLNNLSVPRWQFTPADGDCRDCFVTRDGRGVVLQVRQATATALEFWDGPTGRRLWRRTNLPSSVLAQSPDGRTFAASIGPDVALLETATGQVRHTFRGHRADVRAACFSPDGRVLAVASPDSPVLLWDVAGELTRGGAPPKPEAAWADLASLDAAVAFRAVRRLSWFPDQAVSMLRAKLPPPAAVDEKTIARLIAALDAPAFADREAAAAGLKALGDLARPGLEAAVKNTESAEVRARIESLLDPSAWVAQNGDYLRTIRAAEVVERIGTPAARELLKAWAGGAAGARLTREAKESLARLAKSPGG